MEAKNEKLIPCFIQGGVSKSGKPFIWIHLNGKKVVTQGVFSYLDAETLQILLTQDEERQKQKEQQQGEGD